MTAADGTMVSYQYDTAGNRIKRIVALDNEEPVAANDDAGTVEAIGVVDIDPRTNDSDPDGDPLTISSIATTTPSPGVTVSIINNNTQLRIYADGTATAASKSFYYTVSDGKGGSDSAAVNYSVEPYDPFDDPIDPF